jgi:hypothetical protein
MAFIPAGKNQRIEDYQSGRPEKQIGRTGLRNLSGPYGTYLESGSSSAVGGAFPLPAPRLKGPTFVVGPFLSSRIQEVPATSFNTACLISSGVMPQFP